MNSLQTTALRTLRRGSISLETQVIDTCALLYCRQGEAVLLVNYHRHELRQDTILNLFPADIIQWQTISDDADIDMLSYSRDMLREASMNIEHTIYDTMRRWRSCSIAEVVHGQVDPMFRILRYYFSVPDCTVRPAMLLMQLKTFFLGFHDYLLRHPESIPTTTVSQRTEELFGRFMELLEHDYRISREVNYYANRLCITRKYLGVVVGKKTDKTPKALIDEYVILQLKLSLRSTNDSVKQLAQQYHFSDASFLVRYFREHTGQTPAGFRQQSVVAD